MDNIYNSIFLTAQYIKQKHPDIKKAYVIGEDPLREEIQNLGIEINDKSHDETYMKFSHLNSEEIYEHGSKEVANMEVKYDAVIQGFERQINFYKLNFASLLVQNGAKWIATNGDMGRTTKNGMVEVANGNYIECIKTVSGKKPVVVGKPNGFCWELMHEIGGQDKGRVLMVGDNVETDMEFAGMAGLDSLLVMTGVTTMESLDRNLMDLQGNLVESRIPKYIAEDLRL